MKKRKNKSEIKKVGRKKIDKDKFIDGLIDKSKLLHVQNDDINSKDEDSNGYLDMITVSNASNQKDQALYLTPKGILWATLSAYYDIGKNLKNFDDFSEELLKCLSMLATNNESPNMFGKNFNDFFEIFIRSMNLAGKLKQVLDENGIYFDIKKYLTDDSNVSNDSNDDNDDTEGNDKPKKK